MPVTNSDVRKRLIACCLVALISLPALAADGIRPHIFVGSKASEKERYAGLELQRYLFRRTGTLLPITEGNPGKPTSGSLLVGRTFLNAALATSARSGDSSTPLGDEGYIVRNLDSKPVTVIAGETDQGTLYGVYAFLEECYGMRFYLTGDVFPPQLQPLGTPPDFELRATPRQRIRGFLPWTNFPQSATSYSIEDYRFIIDQMTKMRMNFIHLHNYNGEGWHNEMFHNFAFNGRLSRVWFPTARTGHAWAGPPWDVSQYLFGARGLFDLYNFGSDAALHNETLSNEAVWGKGRALFQQVLRYAHQRGVKIGLGIDVDVVPREYATKADNPDVLDARVDQIAQDYPDLDYFMAFRSEGIGKDQKSEYWRSLFGRLYKRFREKAPKTGLAVSGWGLPADEVAALPADVICAPIAPYSAGWDDGSLYGTREYWACPWLERDFNSSVHYYPYNIHLGDTIKAYAGASTNTQGLLCLTWRIGDAVEAKMWYIAHAPWDTQKKLSSSEAVYGDYARANYGAIAAEVVTPIINENEAFASLTSECEVTAELRNTPRTTDTMQARVQVMKVTDAMQVTDDVAQRSRLELLRQRLLAVEAYTRLDEKFSSMSAQELTDTFRQWATSFVRRVNDISSLGNVVSSQNRLVQLRYLPRMAELGVSPGSMASNTTDPLQVVVISPPVSLPANASFDIEARVPLAMSMRPAVTLHWRTASTTTADWKRAEMEPRAGGIYAARLTPESHRGRMLEYWVSAKSGSAVGEWPAGGDKYPASCVMETPRTLKTAELAPPKLQADGRQLRWSKNGPTPFSWKIYRSRDTQQRLNRSHYVTYVAGDTTSFQDRAAGENLYGAYYYFVTASEVNGRESAPSQAVQIDYPISELVDLYTPRRASDATFANAAVQVPCPQAWYAMQLSHLSTLGWQYVRFDPSTTAAALLVRYSCENLTGTLEIRANNPLIGKLLGKLELQRTGGWDTYIRRIALLDLSESSATQSLWIRCAGPWGNLVRIESIHLRPPDAAYEAEDGDIVGGQVYDDEKASDKRGVGFFGSRPGDAITLLVPPSPSVRIRYSNENVTTRTATVSSGDQMLGKVEFVPTGKWTDYQELASPGPNQSGQLKLEFRGDDFTTETLGKFAVNVDCVMPGLQ